VNDPTEPSTRRVRPAAVSLRGLAGLLPRRSDYAGLAASWRGDVLAGVTVGVVALPLALAFGITTGLGAQAGLVTAIVAGLVAAVFGGSNVQVSGPTGAMTVVLVPVVAQHGASAVYVVGIMAGLLVVAAAVLRLGRFLAYIPWPVVEGFTVGIACIIFLQQVPAALGVPKPEGENTVAVAIRALHAALEGNGTIAALAVSGVVAVVMVVLPKLHRSLPASLLAVAVATAVAQLTHADVARIGALPSSLPGPHLPTTSLAQISGLFGAAFAVAALAAIESLLSAKVADGMANQPRHDPDRELFGQGLANIASPLFGGMPATGAIARTAVNVRAGGRTRVAAAVHALVLVAVVYLGGSLVAKIPLAALAGVLMVTAVRMIEPHNIRAVVRATRGDAAVLITTAAVTLAFDLIRAVEAGVAVAAILALRHVARSAEARAEPVPDDSDDTDANPPLSSRILTYRLDGPLFFGAAQRFLTELTAVTDIDVVILRLPDIQVLDATGAQTLTETIRELEHRGITVLIKGARPEHLRTLRAAGTINELAHHNHLFDNLADAIAHARHHVTRSLTSEEDATTPDEPIARVADAS
jgi:sulfate permease, SulP family